MTQSPAVRAHNCLTRLARSLIVALQLTAFAPALEAQQSATEASPEVVVTGTHLPITSGGLAQNVSVIDARHIRQFDPGRLEDILSQVNSVYVDSAGATGGYSSLYMRGGENSHLLVLIDGVKVNDPTSTRGSAYDLSTIDVSQIERIEILRGPASAIYGAEALAGVLSIVTRSPSGSGIHASGYGGVGQDNFARLGGSLSAGNEVLLGQFGIGATRDGETNDPASIRLNTFSGSLRYAPNSMLAGEFFARQTDRDSEAFPDDSGGPRLAVNRQQTMREARDTTYGVKATWGSQSLRIEAGGSAYERKERSDNPFIDAGVRFPVPAFTSDTTFRRSSINLTATYDPRASTSLVAGIEHQDEKGRLISVGDFLFSGNPLTLNFEMRRGTDSIFAEGRFRLAPPLSLQIGVRRDKVERLGSETSPHLGLVWDVPNTATSLKASYSEGFKPPSFFALGFPIGANPALEPEFSRNAELTLVQSIGSGESSAQISLFHTTYQNLVDFDSTTFQYVNRGKIIVKGIEPMVNFRLGSRLKAQVGLTLLEISELDGLAPLRNRPERRVTANVVYDLTDRSSLFTVLNDNSEFIDRSNPTGDIEMPGYARVDAGYSLRVKAFRVKFSIDNLFNEGYEQFVGFPGQDRRLRIELLGEF